tara:strand:- start:1004 stop:1192 length:189 start_codon:yes stop_codon:yes gene_type:complete
MISKDTAAEMYDEMFYESKIPGRAWMSISHRKSGLTVEVPRFSMHIVRRVIRILFLSSSEGP